MSTTGLICYATFVVSGMRAASTQGTKSAVANKWVDRLRHPCRLGGPHRFKARDNISTGTQVGKRTTSTLQSMGSPTLQSKDTISSGTQVGKMATQPVLSRGCPTPQSKGGNQLWPTSEGMGYVTFAIQGGPQGLRLGDKISTRPQLSGLTMSPLTYRGFPNPSGRGTQSPRVQKWAD